MNVIHIPTLPAASDSERLDAVIREFGAIRVLRAALSALYRDRRRLRQYGVDALSDHVRRDIGLPPFAEPPSRDYWRHLR